MFITSALNDSEHRRWQVPRAIIRGISRCMECGGKGAARHAALAQPRTDRRSPAATSRLADSHLPHRIPGTMMANHTFGQPQSLAGIEPKRCRAAHATAVHACASQSASLAKPAILARRWGAAMALTRQIAEAAGGHLRGASGYIWILIKWIDGLLQARLSGLCSESTNRN